MEKKRGKIIIENIKSQSWNKIEQEASKIRRIFIFKTFLNLNINRIKIIFKFFYSIFYRVLYKNGLIVSFTGIDGAGKTSVKKYFLEKGDKYFIKGKMKEFYWRPFLLPAIAKLLGSKGQEEKLDSSGKRILKNNKTNKIKSYIKYFYYVSDFVFGKIKYFNQSHTGGLILFDRYHFDNIIYPERFGFSIGKNVMRFFDKWIVPQPDIIFYLTADSDVLYNRKYEINIDEINAQKNIYEKEILKKGKIITLNTNTTFEETIDEILFHCLNHMSNRGLNDR